MPWDPDRYRAFKEQRFAPFEDLFAMVRVRPGLRVIDLGCGTGELTGRLAARLPGSDVVGIDSSAEMLEQARPFARAGLRFEHGAIEEIEGRWDLVFSHAAIQWVANHAHLVPRLLSLVGPGGQLAVQLPSNHGHPSHTLIRELAAAEPFRTALGGWTRTAPVLPLDEYAGLLYAAGADNIAVFEKVYPHVLPDADAIADWTSGTALIPLFERLPADLRAEFDGRYRARLRALFPQAPVFYPFRRILFSATRPA
jgi:trans-aconitate 2-methyltransferase